MCTKNQHTNVTGRGLHGCVSEQLVHMALVLLYYSCFPQVYDVLGTLLLMLQNARQWTSGVSWFLKFMEKRVVDHSSE